MTLVFDTVTPAVDPAKFDTTAAPCGDFYQYVNGGWIARVSSDTAVRSTFKELRIHRDTLMRRIIEQARAAVPTTNDPVTRVLGMLYNSCLADKTFSLASMKVAGAPGDSLRARYCQKHQALADVLGQAFARITWQPVRQAQAETLLANIEEVLQTRLRAATWLSDATRQRLAGRVQTIFIQLGTPPTQVDYADLALSPTDFLQNVTAVQARLSTMTPVSKSATLSSAPVRTDPWQSSDVQAHYTAVDHFFTVTAVWLQRPLFDPAADAPLNYGAAGVVIAHELAHGADSTYNSNQWRQLIKGWSPADTLALAERVRRLHAQYVAAGQQVAFVDMYENRADLTGLYTAYDAMQRAIAGQPRRLIDGLTPEQRFFITYANTLRQRDGAPSEQKTTNRNNDPHAPDHVRVNVPLSNMSEFAKAFGCKTGDPMVRSDSGRVNIF